MKNPDHLPDILFNPGGIVDRVDLRDYQFKEVGMATTPFDWNTGFDIESKVGIIRPKDQGDSGSCGGQAWATLASVLEGISTGTFEERSAKYIYAQTYQQGGGSTARDNANIFVLQGVSREAVLSSYMLGAPPTEAFMERGGDITLESRVDALLAQASVYAQVGNNIDEVARAIRDNNGCVLGIVGQNNGTWLSLFPEIPVYTQWRHFIYAGRAKLINGVKHIGFINSWGSVVGDRGWQWLDEAYFSASPNGEPCIWTVYTHVFKNNTIPTPVTFHHTFNIDLGYQGRTGKEVVALQDALKLEGVFPANVNSTGYFGLVTKNAVIKYQTLKRISPITGFVGPITRAELNKTYSIIH